MRTNETLKAELTAAVVEYNREVAAYKSASTALLASLGSRCLASQADEGTALAATHAALLTKRKAVISLRRRYRAAAKGQNQPRTKEAVIELFADDPDSSLVTAYDTAVWDVLTPDSEDEYPEPVFEGSCTMNIPVDASQAEHDRLGALGEKNATLQVLGWLWKHGYKSARWGTRCDVGSGRPDWATKDAYEWGDKA